MTAYFDDFINIDCLLCSTVIFDSFVFLSSTSSVSPWHLSSSVALRCFYDCLTHNDTFLWLVPTISHTSSCAHSYLFLTAAEIKISDWIKSKSKYQNRNKKCFAFEHISSIVNEVIKTISSFSTQNKIKPC